MTIKKITQVFAHYNKFEINNYYLKIFYMVLIGIAGKKYSGKDNNILVKSNFRKISFARNLKEILKVMLDGMMMF